MNFYNNFWILIKVSYQPLMKAVIHIPAISCRWINIILQLWQNLCLCNTHCVRSINKWEENTEGTERAAQHCFPVCVVKHVSVVSLYHTGESRE